MRRTVLAFILVLVFLAMVLGAMVVGRAAVSKKHNDSIGIVMQQGNPMSYIEGVVTNASLIEHGINLRIQPRGTYALFTEDILFCDTEHVVSLFEGKRGPVVLTYETRAHRMIEEVSCHDLKYVDELKSQEGLQ